MTVPPTVSGSTGRRQADALAVLERLGLALDRQDRAEQVRLIARLLELEAPLAGQWQAISGLLAGLGEFTMARRAIDRFVEAERGSVMAQYYRITLLEQTGALGEAYDLMLRLPDDVPDRAAVAYGRGTAALYLGEREAARTYLDASLRLRPGFGPAWLSRALAAGTGEGDDWTQALLQAESAVRPGGHQQLAPYLYAKGKVLAERGDHAAAFASFAEAALQAALAGPYDRDADRREAELSLEGFTPDSIAQLAKAGNGRPSRTIFVTGLARSGTTLVEQILASHSAIGGGGEIERLPLVARELGGASHAALARFAAGRGLPDAAGLWSHWLSERCPGPGLVVDKSLSTTRMIGLAATLLPDAPLIWLTRDPLDRAWSCYRTYFPGNLAWTNDLEDIAFHFRLEDLLLQRWREILGARLLVVPYEELVGQPEHWIRRIAAHCGLSEEPAMFAPHRTRRLVTSASVAQVRRPINRDGIGSALPYREFLQPFMDAYYR